MPFSPSGSPRSIQSAALCEATGSIVARGLGRAYRHSVLPVSASASWRQGQALAAAASRHGTFSTWFISAVINPRLEEVGPVTAAAWLSSNTGQQQRIARLVVSGCFGTVAARIRRYWAFASRPTPTTPRSAAIRICQDLLEEGAPPGHPRPQGEQMPDQPPTSLRLLMVGDGRARAEWRESWRAGAQRAGGLSVGADWRVVCAHEWGAFAQLDWPAIAGADCGGRPACSMQLPAHSPMVYAMRRLARAAAPRSGGWVRCD